MKRKANNSLPSKGSRRVSPSTRRGVAQADKEATAPEPPTTSPSRRLSMSDYTPNLLKFLDEDRRRRRFCDVTVCVGEKLYGAHKVVLAHGSSYFHAELSKNPAAVTVTLEHVDDSVFLRLLGLLYTSECVVAEAELPALTEAARFLDMMDVLKVLRGGGGGVGGTPEQLACSLCDRRFCTAGALRSHLARSHGGPRPPSSSVAAAEGGSAAAVVTVATTRKSSRRRSAPAKYKTEEVACAANRLAPRAGEGGGDDEEEEEEEEEEDMGAVKQTPKIDVTVTPKSIPEQEVDEEQEVELAGVKSGGEQRSDGDPGKQQHSYPEEEEEEEEEEGQDEAHSPVAEGSNPAPVYPEGLAPVIIQTSSKRTLKCPKCDKTFDRAGKYESHTRVHTGEKPFQCDVCQQRYSTKSNLTVHRKKHASDTPVQKKEHRCPFCHRLHASRKTLAQHVRRFHPDYIQDFLSMRKKKSDGWKCAVCLKTFTRRPHLEEHMILHTQNRPFKCTFCDDYFKSRFARLKHQEKHHLGPFPCEICGRQFNDTGNRKRHVECTHGGKRKWTCFVCGKSVRERTTLREHMRIHSGEKPHCCSICGQSFRHGSSYRLHLRVHYDDKRYECDKCGKTFIRHDHLTKHQKIHSDSRELAHFRTRDVASHKHWRDTNQALVALCCQHGCRKSDLSLMC